MCGIAGYIGKKSISNKTIYSTGDLMKNRGPNNFSFSHYKKNKINEALNIGKSVGEELLKLAGSEFKKKWIF